MVVPEINAEHIKVIDDQRKRLGTKRGFIAVKSNCSLQSYVPALHPLKKYGIEKALVCTYQAISGAGKTFERWPEMVDNVIPYIGGEEEKSEREPMKMWGHIEDGKIVKADVSIAKNYLSSGEMQELNEIVTMYLDYANRQARRHIPMTMADWASKLDAFLQFNDAEVLQDKGKVTVAIAKAFAESEFEQYRITQDRLYQSDFDRLIASAEKD